MKKALLLVTLFTLLAGVSGCGYTTRSAIRSNFATVHVAPFVNVVDVTQEAYAANKYRIYRPTIETDLSNAVVNKFLSDGNLKPAREGSADLVLKGEVTEFRKDPLRYDDNDEVTEYRVNIVVNLTLMDRKENKTVWSENNFTGDTTYFTAGSQAKSEAQAISDSITDLARRIVERTVEQW